MPVFAYQIDHGILPWSYGVHSSIHYDGVVDEKDMQYVVSNYLMQNPWMEKAPKGEKKVQGKTLEDILKELDM